MTSQENQTLLADDVPAPAQPHVCFIVPLTLLREILNNGNISESTRAALENTYNHCCSLQQKRKAKQAELSAPAAQGSGGLAKAAAVIHREIYDSKRGNQLRNTLLLKDGRNPKPTSSDVSANELFVGFGKTYQFYQEVFKRSSVDDKNWKLIGSVHFDDKPGPPGMDNAFWDGDETGFGDGDGEVFGSFTKDLDVIAHELTHGVVQFTANLELEYQSGALNESVADVFGSMIKQYFHPDGQQTAEAADWLIGEQIFLPSIDALALRSLKAPGTAYNNSILGKDPQPADMDGYVDSPNTEDGDWGGVHTNSGIPNHAFFLAAIALGGHSWDQAGKIWYAALQDEKLRRINTRKAFKIFAELTVKYALKLFGADAEAAVKKAWTTVKVLTTAGQHREEL